MPYQLSLYIGRWGRGKGLLVPVCWGKGSDAPPASTDVAHAPSASFWREGVLLMCGGDLSIFTLHYKLFTKKTIFTQFVTILHHIENELSFIFLQVQIKLA